ncbi:unnamed protein product [Tilletia laevis]|uniref:Uncharacterized protein n=2 Tax=Tilletia TaxID=13289 RepID=A0A9N8MAA4_9BASI|nr:hypothetical protein A4X03_0g8525 [Tilletia caries]CAD6934717.1 unnamed protein product [Tilletia caries]CAD6965240.1 unnamed protein product [Tilletia laevis]CAD6970891.1 unnamed protein product [Tilletia controversa]CAD7068658.1 unnamed protein product [Tilletia caries]
MSFEVNTPAVLIQCQPYSIAWTGGLAPFYPVITQGGDIGSIIKNFGEQNGKQVPWIVDQPVGDTVTFVVVDSQGQTATSGTSPAVVKGTSDDCMKKKDDGSPPAPSNTTATPGTHSNAPSSTSATTSKSASASASPSAKADDAADKVDDNNNSASTPTPDGTDPDTVERPTAPPTDSSAQPAAKSVWSGALALLLGAVGLVTLTV